MVLGPLRYHELELQEILGEDEHAAQPFLDRVAIKFVDQDGSGATIVGAVSLPVSHPYI